MLRRQPFIASVACLLVAGLTPVAAQTPPVAQAPASDIKTLLDAQRYREAEPLIRRRLEELAAAKRSETPESADHMEWLAQVLTFTGRQAEAERMMRQSIAIREKAGDPVALGRSMNRLAFVLEGQQRFADAEALARRAVGTLEPVPDQGKLLSAAYGTLGASLNGQRRFSEAAIAYGKALEIGRKTLGEDDPFVAEQYNDVALNLEAMGKLAEAEPIYRRSLDIITKAKGEGDIDTARTLALLASNLQSQAAQLNRTDPVADMDSDKVKRDEAEQKLRAAIAIREKVLGEQNPDTLRSLGNLVGLLRDSVKYKEAVAVQERVMALRETAPGTSFADRIADQGRMAAILKQKGEPAKALPYQRRAFEMARERLDEGHPYLATARLNLAMALMLLDKKNPEYLQLISDAVAVVRSERGRATSLRRTSGATLAERALAQALGDDARPDDVTRSVYVTGIGLNQTRGIAFPSEEQKRRNTAFEIAQDLALTASARALTLTAAREALGDTPLARLVRRQQDLAASARDKEEALVAAIGRPPEETAKLRAELDAIGVELAAADVRIRKAYPDYARLVAPRPLSEAEVRKRLRPGEGLLMIVDAGPLAYSFAMSRKGATWSSTSIAFGQAQLAIESMRCDVDALTCKKPKTSADTFDTVSAHELYRHLVEPVESVLGGVKTLYVMTSGSMSDLPFAALLTKPTSGSDTATLAAAPWLGDRYAFVSLPSVSALRSVRNAPASKRDAVQFVGYGAPVLGETGQARAIPAAMAPKGSSSGAPSLADPAQLRGLPSLPGTEVELKAMAETLDAPAGAVRLGAAATEAAVRGDAGVRGARILAFATHGLLPGELDGFTEPGLVFTPPAAASAGDDGILAASEVASMDLAADWVILSACNTASPEGGSGSDSLSALARAFLYAGADSLLASHWRVGDDVTAALTVEALANERRAPKAGRSEALQKAMRAIRTGKRADGSAIAGWNSDWAHPAAWAPFTIIAASN